MEDNLVTSERNEVESQIQRKEIPPNLKKICLVCGDKALGYNFNVISCESCKAFFRRNALTSKEFKCPFSNNCEITVVTRRFCQKCRLEKCLSVGMVKEFIMSEEDKAEKRRKIEENRAKKRHTTIEPDDGVSSSKNYKQDEIYNTPIQESTVQYDVLNSTTCSPHSTVQSPQSAELDSSIQSPIYHQYTQISNDVPYMKVYPIDEKSVINRSLYEQRVLMDQYPMCDSMDNTNMSLYSEPQKQNSIRSILENGDTTVYREAEPDEHVCEEIPSTSSDPNVNKARDILQDVERIEPNSMESILCEAIKLEFEASSVNPCSGSSRELNEVERAKLNELIVANKALHAPIDDDVSALIGDTASTAGLKDGTSKHDPRLITIVNLTAVAIRRFIKMAKKINAFKNMCEEDQVALLKGGCIEMLILRSTMTYDGQRNTWKLPHSQEQYGSIRTDVLKLAKGNIYRSHEAFITTFDPKWRTDENIILIMSAILLFSPDRAKIVHRDVIKLEQIFHFGISVSFTHTVNNVIKRDRNAGLKSEFVYKPAHQVTQNQYNLNFTVTPFPYKNSYYYLLRRYLESVYPGCEAKSTFLKLIQKILEMRKLAEEVTGVYLDVNPIEPLLMEIFDLKHHAA